MTSRGWPNVSAPRESWMTHLFQKWAEYVSRGPEFESWVPTIEASAPLVLDGAATIQNAKYSIVGNLVFFNLRAVIKVSTEGSRVTFTLPTSCKDSIAGYWAFASKMYNGTNHYPAASFTLNAGTGLIDAVTYPFTVGDLRSFAVQGFYERA